MTEPQAQAALEAAAMLPPPTVAGLPTFIFDAYPVQPARETPRKHLCACSWGVKCKALRTIFSTREGDPRGGEPRRFDLTSERNKNWKRCIAVNLQANLKTLTENQLKTVRVAKHHWNCKQNLAYARGGRICAPIPRDVAISLLDDGKDLNQRCKVKKKVQKKNEPPTFLYFNHPNVSLASLCEELNIDIDEGGVVTPRVPTAREQRAQRAKAAAEEQRERSRRQEFASLSYESWCATQDANAERQKTLELEVKRLKADQKQMRSIHDQQEKEKSQEIKSLKQIIAARDRRKRLARKGPASSSQSPSKRKCPPNSTTDGNNGSAAGSSQV